MPHATPDPVDVLIASGLDLSRPFTTQMARDHGISDTALSTLCATGVLSRPLRGCYYSAHLPESLDLRVGCLLLVMSGDSVVTDRTAGWLHGASTILAPGDHLVVPKVSAFQPPGRRLRNKFSTSGERSLPPRDLMEVHGVTVTTPLRTACDLGRLLHRDSAFAALDSMLRLGAFSSDDLAVEVLRFAGYRGVCQLRAFAPLADAGSESYGESVLRLRWYDGSAPGRPETQVEVRSPNGRFVARVDLAHREWRYAAEYDGAEFHGPEQQEHDQQRREELRELGWMVDVFRREQVFGRQQSADIALRQGATRARVRFRAGSAS